MDIAFSEAIAAYADQAGIDFEALRSAVHTKENVRLPGVDYGIGGACLPYALTLLHEAAPSPLFRGAKKADARYRRRLFRRLLEAPGDVLLRGIGYKQGVSDLANSRAVELARGLMAAGKRVWIEDPLVNDETLLAAGLLPLSCRNRSEAFGAVVTRGRFATEGKEPAHG